MEAPSHCCGILLININILTSRDEPTTTSDDRLITMRPGDDDDDDDEAFDDEAMETINRLKDRNTASDIIERCAVTVGQPGKDLLSSLHLLACGLLLCPFLPLASAPTIGTLLLGCISAVRRQRPSGTSRQAPLPSHRQIHTQSAAVIACRTKSNQPCPLA